MKFYAYHDGISDQFFKRKGDALKEARANTPKGHVCDVDAVDIGKLDADTAEKLMNGGDVIESRETVQTVKGSWELEL